MTKEGCLLPPRRISVPGGSVTLGPTDWDSAEIVERTTLSVRPFLIDRTEVTQARFLQCVEAGGCAAIPPGPEPGAPVRNVSLEQAAAYCSFEGGRLPTPAEWTFAATGQSGRRFPWGAHGLVCRRASFGLSDGPCAEGGAAPELPGMRPDGQTPEGIFDLAGNVAEWAVSPKGKPSVHGGSFASKLAGQLKVWARSKPVARPEVGFRCVYDAQPGER